MKKRNFKNRVLSVIMAAALVVSGTNATPFVAVAEETTAGIPESGTGSTVEAAVLSEETKADSPDTEKDTKAESVPEKENQVSDGKKQDKPAKEPVTEAATEEKATEPVTEPETAAEKATEKATEPATEAPEKDTGKPDTGKNEDAAEAPEKETSASTEDTSPAEDATEKNTETEKVTEEGSHSEGQDIPKEDPSVPEDNKEAETSAENPDIQEDVGASENGSIPDTEGDIPKETDISKEGLDAPLEGNGTETENSGAEGSVTEESGAEDPETKEPETEEPETKESDTEENETELFLDELSCSNGNLTISVKPDGQEGFPEGTSIEVKTLKDMFLEESDYEELQASYEEETFHAALKEYIQKIMEKEYSEESSGQYSSVFTEVCPVKVSFSDKDGEPADFGKLHYSVEFHDDSYIQKLHNKEASVKVFGYKEDGDAITADIFDGKDVKMALSEEKAELTFDSEKGSFLFGWVDETWEKETETEETLEDMAFDISEGSLLVEENEDGTFIAYYMDEVYDGLDGKFLIEGTGSGNEVSIKSDHEAELVLSNVGIVSEQPISLSGKGTFKVTLRGENILSSDAAAHAAFEVGEETTVHFYGDGTLVADATGGAYEAALLSADEEAPAAGYGAGIGADAGEACGNILIHGGLIKAYGNAGVGSEMGGKGKTVMAGGGNIKSAVPDAAGPDGRHVYPVVMEGMPSGMLFPEVLVDGEEYAYGGGPADADGTFVMYLPVGEITILLNGMEYHAVNSEDGVTVKAEQGMLEGTLDADMGRTLKLDPEKFSMGEDAEIALASRVIPDSEGDVTANHAELVVHAAFQEGVQVPEHVVLNGNQVQDEKGTTYFSITPEKEPAAKAQFTAAEVDGQEVTLTVSADSEEGAKDLFEGWNLTMHGDSFRLGEEESKETVKQIEDYLNRMAATANGDVFTETASDLAREDEEAEAAAMGLDTGQVPAEEAGAEVEVPSGGVFDESTGTANIRAQFSFQSLVDAGGPETVQASAKGVVDAAATELDLISTYAAGGFAYGRGLFELGDAKTVGIPYIYGVSQFKSATWENCEFGPGMGKQKTVGKNGHKYEGNIYREFTNSSKDNNVYVLMKNSGYAYINGKYEKLDIKVYLWTNAAKGCVVNASAPDRMIHFGSRGLMCTPVELEDYSRIGMSLEFYLAGTSTKVKPKGIVELRDVDGRDDKNRTQEGYAFYSAATDAYWLTKDTDIIQCKNGLDPSGKGSTYDCFMGTISSDEGSWAHSLFVTFDAAKADFKFHYYCQDIYYMSFDLNPVTLTYNLVGEIPAKVKAPSAKRLAYGTNTVDGFLNYDVGNYTAAPGYTFSGWKTGSIKGSNYTGEPQMLEDLAVYGEYIPDVGNLTVTKSLDGVADADIAAANKTFTFKLSGTSISGKKVDESITIVGAKSGTFKGIPVGTYTLTETCKAGIWTPEGVPAQIVIRKDETSTIRVINKENTGSLKITKEIEGGDASSIPDANKTFTFTLSGTADNGVKVSESKQIKGSGSTTFSNIPVGTFTLTESYSDGLWVSSAKTQTVVIQNAKTTNVTVTNTVKRGNLTVTKKVAGMKAGDVPDANKVFTFTLSGTADNGTAVSLQKEIKGAGTVTFSDVPVGTYTLTESYKNGIWTSSASSQKVIIPYNDTKSVDVTNTVTSGNLTVTKVLEGVKAGEVPDANKIFDFTLSGTATNGVTINETVQIKGSGSATFSGIPVGKYTLTESYKDGIWTSSAKTQTVDITAGNTARVTVTNTVKTGSLVITKQIDKIEPGAVPNANKTFNFNLKGTANNGTSVNMDKSIVGAGSISFDSVPVGTYTLTETYNTGLWTSDTVTKTVSIQSGTATSVTVKNSAKVGSVRITKKVVDPSGIVKLNGFVFRLSGTSTLGAPVNLTGKTDDKGILVFQDVPLGTYTVTEIGTPENQNSISSAWEVNPRTQNVTVEAGKEAQASVTNTYYRGSIKLIKYAPDGKTPVSGVTFELKNTRTGETKNLVTDAKGEVFIDHLLLETYEITEIKTKPGYQLLSEKLSVKLPLKLTDAQVAADPFIDTSKAEHDVANKIYYFYDVTYKITNNAKLDMPASGGGGYPLPFMLSGAAALAAGLYILLMDRRRRFHF